MSISININATNQIENENTYINKLQKENTNPFFAGNSNLANDPIAEKRKEAQEKAWKVISDAWDVDKSIDKSVEDRKKDYDKWLERKKDAQEQLKGIEEQMDALKEEYGITDEMSYRDYPSEYKQRYLELHKQAGAFQEEIYNADKYMKDDIRDIKAIAIEHLKSDPMAEANKTADMIMDAASDEILGMVMQQGQENIDEKMEEVTEKAKEQAKKEEIKEEKLEDIKEIKALQEAVIEGTKEAVERADARHRENEAPELPIDELIKLTQVNSETSKAQKTLDEIKYSMNLLEADLKGIEIDEDL